MRIINDAPLVLRGKVVTEGMLLYAQDESVRVEFETTTCFPGSKSAYQQ